ncbi:MinD/ParA family ATP-binding protein [Polyangium mundeleinium]|uniref:CobQ/CobB/MinD/ParA nucleotide binding domain-containing protein n=1 Tax=Polyangium mundeleinium TaxID=2995306 RepID=A0ABT5F6L5_9BACT|nr:hypothetical protein [Polyangium mundeleinium]MDC0749219.1 hypothetical protein [Polyangium mundeleinium]
MLTGADLIAQIDAAFPGETRRRFQFPFVRIHVVSASFEGIDEDDREQFLARRVRISIADLQAVCNRLFFRLDLQTPGEASTARKADRGHFWARLLIEEDPQPEPLDSPSPLVAHFYGYKGGQTRSTVLCFLARKLADDGWRVLTIDVDAEAPSLDILFGTPAWGMASSILGIHAGADVTPVRAVTPARGRGYVDVLPFRPQGERFDLDAAALALEGNVHPPSQSKIISGVVKLAVDYDVVLVDHRTGLSSTLPPWVRHLPGPVIVFARMDGQWRPAKNHLRHLWSLRPRNPGALVSFKPDNESTVEEYRRRMWDQASEPVGELAAAKATPEMDPDDVPTAEDIADHWIVWPYDTAFNETRVPDAGRVGAAVRESCEMLRRLLDLAGRPAVEKIASAPTKQAVLHPSGALDEGDLIQTEALRALRPRNSPYIFIVGRKGTGKTRLMRTLVEENLGEALLVPSEVAGETGITAGDTVLQEFARKTSRDPELFWWTLLRVALEREDTERSAMSAALDMAGHEAERSLRLARMAAANAACARTFLIDGLETAFRPAETFDFVGALFRVESALRSDPVFSDKVRMRIFIRKDLADRGYENFEQQAHGRRWDLVWYTQGILNFALSRIRKLPWFERRFAAAYEVINEHEYAGAILNGALTVEACEELLLEIFPRNLGRLNLNTTTFLKTYFSDDPTGESSYYPRIYDDFLRIIAGQDAKRRAFHGPELGDDGKISDALVFFAHEEAAAKFLIDVNAELRNLVEMDNEMLSRLIAAFAGTVTPFEVESRRDELASRTGIDRVTVGHALDRMRQFGIFEDRPKYPGQWRAGRLFKTSLRMRYYRKRKGEE